MVIASHVIFSTYGFWLPNDPRGSWSDFVRAFKLTAYGPASKIDERHSVAGVRHDWRRRVEAKRALRYPEVAFTGVQARSVGKGFAVAAGESGYHILACSILPRHVHMVIGRHHWMAERIVGHLKARATQQLVADGIHPFLESRAADGTLPPIWGRRAWRVYLDSTSDVERAVQYVRGNPAKEGKPPQRWSFVRG